MLGAPGIAHADQGPGYGGDADGLEVTWKEPKSKAMAAEPPPVPSGGDGGSTPTADPERLAMEAADVTLQVDGIGFRGLSEVAIQFGSEPPTVVRADQTGTMAASFPATEAADPGTTVVAVGRSPSGATRTLVGSVPPLAFGTDLMGLVPWLVAIPVVLIAIAALMRRRPRPPAETAILLLEPAPAGPMISPGPPPLSDPPPAGSHFALDPPKNP